MLRRKTPLSKRRTQRPGHIRKGNHRGMQTFDRCVSHLVDVAFRMDSPKRHPEGSHLKEVFPSPAAEQVRRRGRNPPFCCFTRRYTNFENCSRWLATVSWRLLYRWKIENLFEWGIGMFISSSKPVDPAPTIAGLSLGRLVSPSFNPRILELTSAEGLSGGWQ